MLYFVLINSVLFNLLCAWNMCVVLHMGSKWLPVLNVQAKNILLYNGALFYIGRSPMFNEVLWGCFCVCVCVCVCARARACVCVEGGICR